MLCRHAPLVVAYGRRYQEARGVNRHEKKTCLQFHMFEVPLSALPGQRDTLYVTCTFIPGNTSLLLASSWMARLSVQVPGQDDAVHLLFNPFMVDNDPVD